MKQGCHQRRVSTSYFAKLLQSYFAILLSFLFVFSSPLISAGESDVVRIAMAISPLSSPFIIAHENGFFKDAGVNVEIKQMKGGHLALKSVLAGEADIATSSEAVLMFNSFERNDFSLFCTFVTSDNDVKILARSDSGIKNISDLKGKKVGTIIGTSAHFFLSHTLLMNGVLEKDVHISALKPQEAKKSLENKKLDAVVTWEPFAYLAQKELGLKVKLIEHDRVYVETFNALTKKNYAKNNVDKLSKITQALIKATDYIKYNPEETQKIVAKVLGENLEVIKSTWKDFSFAVGIKQWLLASMETEARWAIEHEFLNADKIPNYMDFINTKPLEKVAPEKITIYK